jgi:hypothetical protein
MPADIRQLCVTSENSRVIHRLGIRLHVAYHPNAERNSHMSLILDARRERPQSER